MTFRPLWSIIFLRSKSGAVSLLHLLFAGAAANEQEHPSELKVIRTRVSATSSLCVNAAGCCSVTRTLCLYVYLKTERKKRYVRITETTAKRLIKDLGTGSGDERHDEIVTAILAVALCVAPDRERNAHD
jgi:hypothetical protein